ncbi:MAG TPA: asparagine synthase-related protein [Terriglobales bacterium]|nr:asparagine synthase-related protein [Terriglobales bacterium]
MNILGGLVYRDPSRTADRGLLNKLLPGATDSDQVHRIDLSGAVLAGVGSSIVSDRAAHGALVADLDLTNLDDLPGMSEGMSPARCLQELHAQHGTDFVKRLRGAFAIALWSPARRRLVLVADRFGFRRLYYAATDSGVAFGSRVKSPLALPDCPPALDPDAIYAYLNFGTVPAPQSIYKAVRRLAPGQALVWEDGRVTLEQYWDVTYSERSLGRVAAARATYGQTEKAMRQTLGSLDPKQTGAFLSGGTDSSTIVGLMSRLTGERVHAFSIGFQEERYNELEYAELAARHFDAAHYTKIITADEALACLPDVVAAYDEPFGNNSALPTYLCARLARETGVKVLFAGDGGDEIFGGNERYRRDSILSRYHLIPAWLRHGLVEPIVSRFPAEAPGLTGKARRYVERACLPNPDRFYSSEFFVNQNRERLLHPDFLAATTPDWPLEVARRHYNTPSSAAELNRLLHVDLKITLADNDLFKVVRTAEAAGIGVRFPLLDHSLVEFMATLPASYKVHGAEKRYIFKEAFAGLLPEKILAKVKHGFGLPTSDWLKRHPGFRELGRDVLLSSRSLQRGYFAAGAVEEMFRLHEADQTPFYGDMLWNVLMLELWHERHGARP